MGIRINVNIGYGLNDLVENDPRIDFARLEDVVYHNQEYTFGDFFDFCERTWGDKLDCHNFKFLKKGCKDKSIRLNDFVCWPNEDSDESGVVLFSLPTRDGENSWFRYNDIVDYYVHGRGTNMETHVEVIRGGIWPFTGRLCKWRTGEWFDWGYAQNFWHDADNGFKDGDISHCGMTYEQFMSEVRPVVPFVIGAMVQFFGIIKDEAVIRSFQPMLVRYWA